MIISDNLTISLHKVLRNLIDEKSKRDQIEFTAYQLAKALGMPRSLITSLTHPDASKRVTNPRITTLLKIIEFFRSDGFDITIEDLLGLQTKTIDITEERAIVTKQHAVTVPIYSLQNKKLGTVNLTIACDLINVISLSIDQDMPPFFKSGSIFIIDQDIHPEKGSLIAATLNNQDQIFIRKYFPSKNKIFLRSLGDEKDIVVMPTMQCKIIGVVVQVNAKT